MDAIKRWLSPKKNKAQEQDLRISPPLPGSFQRLSDSAVCQASVESYTKTNTATTDFVPKEKGREQTLEFLNRGTSRALHHLIKERDIAAKQARRAPKTKGTREVQWILRRPSAKTVEQLHRVKNQAEFTIKYGVPAVAVYNFSKSLSWNRNAPQKLPPLQLRDTRTITRDVCQPSVPPVPFTPINWLVLPVNETRQNASATLFPISEAGGWRALAAVLEHAQSEESEEEEGGHEKASGLPDVSNEVEVDPYDDSPVESSMSSIELWESREARVLEMTEIAHRQVRQVRIPPRQRHPVDELSPIEEESPLG
ncbi:hypothetical protein F5Y15DRAFT_422222 [Xylariaceae sp. FL0016]|nr:hypothetical protein F5Y15DRAFT_422222 [Xylariaceae sp. FL0016]